MDPFALPCHPDLAIGPDDRDWRAIGVRSADDVTRKQTRCPACKTAYTAYLRRAGQDRTVEWVRPTPLRVTAVPTGGGLPLWQDETDGGDHPGDPVRPDLAQLQEQTAGLGEAWHRSVQLVEPVRLLTTGGRVFAAPGDLLLERREKWNAQDRRLALLWSARLQHPVVAWHGFARLLQDAG